MDHNDEQYRPRGQRAGGPHAGGQMPSDPPGIPPEQDYPEQPEPMRPPGRQERPGRPTEALRPVYPLQSLMPESERYPDQGPGVRPDPYGESSLASVPPDDHQLPADGPDYGYETEQSGASPYQPQQHQERRSMPRDDQERWQQPAGFPDQDEHPEPPAEDERYGQPYPAGGEMSAPMLPPAPRQFSPTGGARTGSAGPQGRYRGAGADAGQQGHTPVPQQPDRPGPMGSPAHPELLPLGQAQHPAGSQNRPEPRPRPELAPPMPRAEHQPPVLRQSPPPAGYAGGQGRPSPAPEPRGPVGAGPSAPSAFPPGQGEPSIGQDASFWFPSAGGAPAQGQGQSPGPWPAVQAHTEPPLQEFAGAPASSTLTTALNAPVTPAVGIPQPRVGIQAAASGEEAYERASTEQKTGVGDLDLDALLRLMPELGASDLHLTAASPPLVRVNGDLIPMPDVAPLTPAMIQRVIYSMITQKQRERYEENLELDFSYSVPGAARFRVNLYRQREAMGAAFRSIPFEIKSLEDLGIPESVSSFASLPRGMVLVTGPTGSGKSTTLAALIDLANRTRRDHIMTVEDPIEFLHHHKSCMVNQREVGEDTLSFANALKHVLRQDPDIILVGEMRDLETISVALTAAETGHLVFATLHTQDAAQTIDRVIDVFPPHQQQQVRVQLSGALQGVVCQTLCRLADGKGRVVAAEVMNATPAIRNLIREGKTHQIYSSMQAGAKFGMQTLDQHLAMLVRNRSITVEQGLEKCHHIEDFNRLIGRS